MKFHKLPGTLALLSVLAAAPGCKDFYDVNVSPLAPTKAELFSLLPVTQVAMATSLGDSPSGMSQYTMALMQQLANSRNIGTFNQNGDAFSNEWSSLYTDMLINNQQIITQGTTEQSWTYVGIAQIQRAFVFSQMVDLWGSIPYSQALQGGTIATPRFDSDAAIYNGGDGIQSLFSLIDEGIGNLAKPAPNTGLARADLIYGGNKVSWTHFGNSLKLKLYNQIRKTRNVTADVTPLLANGSNLIQQFNEDFELNYGTTITPDNRNLGFIADYATPGRENRINPNFYLAMSGNADPRVPYYFFNQASTTNSFSALTQDYALGNFVSVRFGSNGPYASSSNSTIITLPGLYPVGGRYDDGKGGVASASSSIPGTVTGKGVVAQRLHTYFSRKFTEAELQLTVLNDNAAATTALRLAIKASFDKVDYVAGKDGSPLMDPAQVAAYINTALALFNRPGATLDDKLEVLMYEKYVASFGYGVDMYTDFRRTGHPRIKVPGNADPARGVFDDNDPVTVSTGAFPRRLNYPLNDLLVNPNGPQTQDSSPLFWDK
ncbi:SusD/RagB family nutrient-binding outer membrane lipoprotein [Hymenobacter segetis]|uniref:SusD/RagB family nutrient-binding outer membrane lipoprotein n=1 Tax=Hymenobacter segetis TaxID=2025509 RepID=A0ABU9LUN0_9BACT